MGLLKAQVIPGKANDFLNSLGAGTHVIQGLDSTAAVAAALKYTGIRNIRDDGTYYLSANSNGGNESELCAIHAETGAMVDQLPVTFMDAAAQSGVNDLNALSTQIEYEYLANCGALLQAEGPNEPNNSPFYSGGNLCSTGGSFLPCAQYMATEYQVIHNQSQYPPNGVCAGPNLSINGSAAGPMPGCTGRGTGTLPSLGIYKLANLTENGAEPDNVQLQNLVVPAGSSLAGIPDGTHYADLANAHNYAEGSQGGLEDGQAYWSMNINCGGTYYGEFDLSGEEWQGTGCGRGTWNKHYAISTTGQNTLPKASTETGWNIDSDTNINADQQGRLMTDVYLDGWDEGWQHTFVYLLLNDSNNSGWGMINAISGSQSAAGNANLMGQYVHNLTTILADTSSNFTPVPVSYKITGLPDYGFSALLQKSNGIYELVIWDEAFASETQSNVTVNFNTSIPSVKVYDITSGTAPVQTLGNVSAVPLVLTDHAEVVEFAWSTSATPTPAATPTPTPSVTPTPKATPTPTVVTMPTPAPSTLKAGAYIIGSPASVIDGGFYTAAHGYPPAAETYPENGNPVGSNLFQQFNFVPSGSGFTICNVQNGACLTLGCGSCIGFKLDPPGPAHGSLHGSDS